MFDSPALRVLSVYGVLVMLPSPYYDILFIYILIINKLKKLILELSNKYAYKKVLKKIPL